MRAIARIVSSALCASLGACWGEGGGLPWPEAPPEARSVFLVRQCGSQLRVEAYDLPHPNLVVTESCSGPLTYWVAFLDRELAAFPLRSGEQSPLACADSNYDCCREIPIPAPPRKWLHRARLSAGETRFSVQDDAVGSGWPTEIAAFRLARECGCPAPRVPELDVETRNLRDHRKLRVAKLAGERLLVLAIAHAMGENVPRSSLFLTSLSELEASGLPPTPFATIDAYIPSELAAFEDGRYFLGLEGWNGHVLSGRVGEAPVLVRHPDPAPDRESHLIALRPGSEDEPEIATLGRYRRAEFEIHRAGAWTRFGDPLLMRGTCSSTFNREQKEDILWYDSETLFVMPIAQDFRTRTVETSSTIPNGLWRLQNGELTWQRLPNPDDDCLYGMVMTERLGLLAFTHAPRVLQLEGETWSELIPANAFERLPFDSGVRTAIDTEDGILYSRGDGLLGLYVDGTRCFELPFANCRVEQFVHVGDTIVGACDAQIVRGDAGLVLIHP